MGSNLNCATQPYQVYPEGGEATDEYRKLMPLLIEDGLEPVSVYNVFERTANSTAEIWKNKWIFTGDGFAYHPDGDHFKIDLDSEHLRAVTTESELMPAQYGGLVIPGGVEAYEAIDSPDFSKKGLKELLGRGLAEEEATQMPILLILSHYNPDLIRARFNAMREAHGYEEGMGIYLENAQQGVPIMRPVVIDRLENRSYVDGYDNLDYRNGRLVGRTPETQN